MVAVVVIVMVMVVEVIVIAKRHAMLLLRDNIALHTHDLVVAHGEILVHVIDRGLEIVRANSGCKGMFEQI